MICKIFTLGTIFSKYMEYVRMLQKRYLTAIIQLFRLLLYILFVVHILGCGFYGIGKSNERSGHNNWLSGYLNSVNEDWIRQYIYAIYWATMTMTTVGYGDVSPKRCNENVYAIFTMIAGSWVFSYSFNVIGTVIVDLRKKEQQF